MKKLLLAVTFIMSGFVFQTAEAQLRISVNANIGSQPVWGPSGYDYAEYYYLPDIDVFYNIPKRQYIYMERNRWVFSTNLPMRYRNFDLYSGYKVVVNDRKPYQNAQMYRTKYAPYKNRHDQQVIRNSHETKYFQIKDHPEHNKWRSPQNNNHRRHH
jgi:hypothetical protein